jgi:hypothetical protein
VLAAQQREEHEQKQRATCSTRSELARARPPAPPRAARCAKAEPAPLPALAPIKPPQASTVLLRARSTSPEPEIAGVCPADSMLAATQSPPHLRPACRALPSHAGPSEETVHASVKLPEQGIGLCLAGEASPRSPDFTRPPVNVGRVSLCPILRFLAHIASTLSCGAHRAI